MSRRVQCKCHIVIEPLEGRLVPAQVGGLSQPVAALIAKATVTAKAARTNLLYRQITPGGPTYGQVVEQIFAASVFPAGGSYKGVSVTRDNVIAERVEANDQGGYYVTVRARYSGRLLGISVAAERARIIYDNGKVSTDLGGFKGVINTRSIGQYLADRLPKLGSSGSTINPLPQPTKTSFKYTIVNDSNETVRFRLPSGKSYSLAEGRKGSYSFTGVASQAKITVLNSGLNYILRAGDHKFFDYKPEDRIGLDLNYKK